MCVCVRFFPSLSLHARGRSLYNTYLHFCGASLIKYGGREASDVHAFKQTIRASPRPARNDQGY